jgi:endonuclease YncB( thermonuclease family)
MATRALTPAAVPKTYAELRRDVAAALHLGQRAIERAKLETYWKTGWLLDAHLQLHAHEVGYGTQTIRRLARDLETDSSVLYRCLRFARAYPIFAGRQKLAWAHYRVLSFIEDEAVRKALEIQALNHGWIAEELEERVRALNTPNDAAVTTDGAATSPADTRPLTAKRGTPGIYPVITRRGRPAVDLGFKLYFRLPADDVRRLRLAAGSIVQAGSDGALVRDDTATKADFYTYRTLEVRVVDGDTLAVTVDLPPHDEADKKLRLRGLNCPELDTPEGKAAKRFVQNLIDQTQEVIVTTTKPDKYDRYLADVYLLLNPGQEIYLNNLLLEKGHAVRMEGSTPKAWDLSA